MENRKRIFVLISLLAILYFVMISFIYYEDMASKEQLLYLALFGIALIVIAAIIGLGALNIHSDYFKNSNITNIGRATGGITFILIVGGGIISLPFYGTQFFSFLGENPYIILIVGIVVFPFAAKYTK